MSWDTAGGGGDWNAGATAEPVVDDFADGAGENLNGGDAEGGEGGGFSGECFNCGQTGLVYLSNVLRLMLILVSHSKQSCPEPPKPRPCFNCGEEGHSKAECTNERVEREFTGTCRICEQVGHRVSTPRTLIPCQLV